MAQMEGFMKSKELMTQLAFDLYDFNNDNRISENDLFRIFRSFDVGLPSGLEDAYANAPQAVFEKALQRDLVVMIKFMQSRKLAKAQLETNKLLKAQQSSSDNQILAKGVDLDPATKYFRNQNVSDVEFDAKKKKIFQALYDIKKEIKKKQDKRLTITSKDGTTISSEVPRKSLKDQQEEIKKQKEEALIRYHNNEDFFNNVFHNHVRKIGKSSNNRFNTGKLGTSQDKNHLASFIQSNFQAL